MILPPTWKKANNYTPKHLACLALADRDWHCHNLVLPRYKAKESPLPRRQDWRNVRTRDNFHTK